MQAKLVKETLYGSLTTNITISEKELSSYRIIEGKPVKLVIPLDGTIVDLLNKAKNLSNVDNELYSMLSNINSNNSEPL